jgi:hypothetical protein
MKRDIFNLIYTAQILRYIFEDKNTQDERERNFDRVNKVVFDIYEKRSDVTKKCFFNDYVCCSIFFIRNG